MRVEVTGTTGFIGRHLVAALHARGTEVRAIHRSHLFDAPALTESCRGADVVVHLAGVVSAIHARDYAFNVESTRAIATAARTAGARLIHISSLAAAGPAPASAPRDEDDPARPLTPYGRSKLDGERAVRDVNGLRWTILRPAAVYGQGDRAMLPLFRFARRGVMPLAGNVRAAYTLVHVSDVIRAIEAAIGADAGGETMFVGHPTPVTARALLEGVRDAVARRAAIVRIPSALTRVMAVAGDLVGAIRGRPLPLNRWRYAEMSAEGFVCRVDRLRDRLGIVAQVDLREGLRQTADWYRRGGWL
jgi:nucleoside-diphosphate-sugar epimerase